jgi:hypothetical protein
MTRNCDNICAMKTQHVHNLHIPFPPALYKELRAESKRHHLPATKLVREAVRLWLLQQKTTSLNRAITEYASQCAGTKFDLDRDLEAATIDFFFEEK